MSDDGLFQLGMDLEAREREAVDTSTFVEPRSTTHTEDTTQVSAPASHAQDDRLDHFIEKDGVRCAGSLRTCVTEAGATLLHIHLHPFQPEGVSGVAVLAESHISVHTWPEAGYAAFDVFMCGDAKPEKCVEVLKRAFTPGRTQVSELLRGKEVA